MAGNLARGDFGRSLVLNQGVFSAVVQRLPVTLSLTLVSMRSPSRRHGAGRAGGELRSTWVDTLVMLLALIGVRSPASGFAILSVILFSVTLHWLPTTGYVPLTAASALAPR